MWVQYNPNPAGKSVGDCAVRAVAKALDVDWGTAYAMIAAKGFELSDMPSSNSVWGACLKDNGFGRYAINTQCPDCYTIGEFLRDHPTGTFAICTGNHVACAINGALFDSWDSSGEVPQFYWIKEPDKGRE